jgi:hypothetical protein
VPENRAHEEGVGLERGGVMGRTICNEYYWDGKPRTMRKLAHLKEMKTANRVSL